MFTQEQLDYWRSLGIEFDGSYDKMAVEAKPELSIVYSSSGADESGYWVNISVRHKFLKTKKAFANLVQVDKKKVIGTHPVALDDNGTTIKLKFPASDAHTIQKAKIYLFCGELEAETTTFPVILQKTETDGDDEIDEDGKERYIRKTLHRIRNYRKSKRLLDINMSVMGYYVLNFDLNGEKLTRVMMQVMKRKDFIDIDVSKITVSEPSNPGLLKTGFTVGGKLRFSFESETDKDFVLDYINGKGDDDFRPAFSKFDISAINTQISARKTDAGLIKQSSTPLCGIAVIGNLIAKHYKSDYQYLVQDLFYYAEAFFGKNSYLIKPRNSITGQNYDVDPKSGSYPGGMPQADYVLLTSIKNSENKVFSFDGLKQFGGITFPSEIISLLSKMLITNEVVDKTSLLGSGMEEMLLLSEMDSNYSEGYECPMLIDANMLDNKIAESDSRPNHWVNYKGGLRLDLQNNKITFKLFTYGLGDKKEFTIDVAVFKKHFYGYIKAKIQ